MGGAELAGACEIVGLGPEDPLADACAAVIATAADRVCVKYADELVSEAGTKIETDLISAADC